MHTYRGVLGIYCRYAVVHALHCICMCFDVMECAEHRYIANEGRVDSICVRNLKKNVKDEYQ